MDQMTTGSFLRMIHEITCLTLRNTKNIRFPFQFYNKIQKKGTFYNLKCKRSLKVMTL